MNIYSFPCKHIHSPTQGNKCAFILFQGSIHEAHNMPNTSKHPAILWTSFWLVFPF